MKYQVGDRVRIRRNLKQGDNFSIYVAKDMEEYAGKIMTISERCELEGSARYKLKENDSCWTWTEDMFEKTIKPTKEELLKMSAGTIIKTDKVGNNRFIFDADYTFASLASGINITRSDITNDLETIDCNCGTKIIEILEPTYTTIWAEETEKREMTVAEIEKELGYPIKIVKEEK